MAQIEQRARVKARRGELKRAILQTVAAAGLISLAVMAPNTIQAVPRSLIKKIFGRPRNSRDAAVSKLVKDGCLTREWHNGLRVLRITAKGRRYIERLQRYEFERPKRWDRRWRLVIFDITEPRRSVRDTFRRELRIVGFQKIQDSVWAYPYPCEEIIALLKADFRIGRDILYLVVEELENDKALRAAFDLPMK